MSFLSRDLAHANKYHADYDNSSRLNMIQALNKHLIDANYMIKQTADYKEDQQPFIDDAKKIKTALKLIDK